MIKIIRLKILTLTLESNRPIKENSSQLRGFFANKFTEHILLHQHIDVNKFIYQYPKIQYKMIDGTPIIIGINEGADVLKKIYDKYDEIQLAGNIYNIFGKGIILKEENFGIATKNIKYKFLNPWFALNEENYQRYKKYNYVERTDQLKSILIRNIMAIAKTFKYFINSKIMVNTRLKETSIKFKGKGMIGFLGAFQVNFKLPNYIGLGKSVSRGFGTIKKLNN
ncbi:hypothetical protein ES705_25420 [subsurface metagenome]